jgi:hypothetical protein
LVLDFLASRTKKNKDLLSRSPNLYYFIITAQVKTYSNRFLLPASTFYYQLTYSFIQQICTEYLDARLFSALWLKQRRKEAKFCSWGLHSKRG